MERTNLLETLTILCLVELLISGCLGQTPSNDKEMDSGSSGDTDTCQGRNCQCSGGPCCDKEGNFKDKSDGSCGQFREERCLEGSCGLSRLYRLVERFCSGFSADCDGETSEPAWLPMQDCKANQVCELVENNLTQCSSCGEFGICQAGACACEFEACPDVCCAEGYICRWSDTCGIGESKLLPADGAEDDRFGSSVALSGNVAIVGAPLLDDDGSNSRSAYIFERIESGEWFQKSRLLPADGAEYGIFGDAVSVSGGVAIVGAPGRDDSPSSPGSAYIFERNDTGKWMEESKLMSADGAGYDRFGCAVSVSGDVAIVGARGDDDNGFSSGSAYIFERNDAGNWIEKSKLAPQDVGEWDAFGSAVSVSGDVAIVGTWGDDDNGFNSGSAYIFERNDAGNWIEKSKLLPADGAEYDSFSISVSVSGDVAIVGAWGDDDNGFNSGSAYIFKRSESGEWLQKSKLLPDDGAEYDEFGRSVSVSGGVAIVGARGDDDSGDSSGSAYIFELNETSEWSQKLKLLPRDGDQYKRFGESVSLDGDVPIIGAPVSNGQPRIGAAYIF